ncbi:phosphoheptose isomerase [Desulfocicer vacuolatum DSM 3385]|uniref:Phosphoheptose isomerase n=1 Tax=Desulfocicer vacuolatum DSM 3385 TaxID=1121400 RepID=A0A1W1YHR0_9BACT|nr:D-sedoheptulose 7-phosphate isomerase [Desulfocicer vacuolatum]SMC35699.1 phosphoheptose isomerase [Desulfocicer vacuolatum DSM 3385]
MKKSILDTLEKSIQVKTEFINHHAGAVEKCAVHMAETFKNGGKLLLFGNGGSAADAQHIAAEFINRFQMERPPLPALALTTDTSVITSIGNDYSFEDIFHKQVQALGCPHDMALGITTSGSSPNVIKAVKTAKKQGLTVIGFSGNRGELKELADFPFCVPSTVTARIQETHILLAHILCDLTEQLLFNHPQCP